MDSSHNIANDLQELRIKCAIYLVFLSQVVSFTTSHDTLKRSSVMKCERRLWESHEFVCAASLVGHQSQENMRRVV